MPAASVSSGNPPPAFTSPQFQADAFFSHIKGQVSHKIVTDGTPLLFFTRG